MLSQKTKADLADAVQALNKGDDSLWAALAPLSRIAETGTDLSIDFSTQSTLGAPLIVARPKASTLPQLTPRQSEVCQALADGLTNKATAARLGISLATVKDHVHAILGRTGLKSRAEIVAHLHGNIVIEPS